MSYTSNESKGILVVILKDNNGLPEPASLEALGKARELADARGCELVAASLGANAPEALATLTAADRVLTCTHESMASFTTESYTDTLLGAIESEKFELVIIPATADGKEFAPYLAGALEVGLAADVINITYTAGKWSAERPCFGGNLISTIEFSDHRPLVVTTRPKVFAEYDGSAHAAEQQEIAANPATGKKVLGYTVETGIVNLGDAELIIAGGRGMGSPENFKMLFDLAELLNGAVAATRAAVDAGWIAYPHQVGQTGKTVRPKVYLACAISGAIQHLAGMRSADCIIAINRDKDASIFKVANYGIVSDALKLIPALVEKLKAR